MNVFSLFAQLVLDTGDFENDLNRVRQTSSSFGSRLKDSFNLASTAGKAAMGIFSAAAIEAGKAFDSSMSQVAATMGLTVSELTTQIGTAQTAFGNFEGTLREFAQFMGANTAFSASEAADALNYMALAGYDAQTSMDMLPNVLNLAAAGSIDLAYASDMVTDASSALGLSIKETSELVDKMATASSKSNTSVAQLGEAILTVGGTAKNLAGGTTELASALGILADNGIKGAEGGTALRNIILSLAAPTDKVKKILEQLGGAEALVYDEAGNMRSLNDIFTDLNNIMSNMQASGRTELIASIFNTTDLKSVESLLANTGERFEELSGYIDNAKGSAEAMAETQLDNLAGDITKFQSAIEGAQIAISDVLTPALRGLVQFGTEIISGLTNAIQDDGLVGAVIKAAAAFGTLKAAMMIKPVFTMLTSGFTDISKAVYNAGRIFKTEMALNALMTSNVGAIGNLKNAVMSLGTAFNSLIPVKSIFTGIASAISAHPIIAVTVAVGALVAACAGLATALSNVKTKADEMTDAFEDMKKASKEDAEAELAQIEHAKSLAYEFKALTESGRKLTEQEKARLDVLYDEINDVLPNLIEKTGEGKTAQYELRDSIEAVTTAMKAQAVYEAYQDDYKESVKGLSDIEKNRENVLLNIASKQKELNDIQQQGFDIWAYGSSQVETALIQEIDDLQKEIKKYDELEGTYETLINNVENLALAIKGGTDNAEAMQTAIHNLGIGLTSVDKMSLADINKELETVNQQIENIGLMLQNVNLSESMREHYNNLLDEINSRKSDLEIAGRATAASFINGLESEYGNIHPVVSDMLKALKGALNLADLKPEGEKAGKTYADGLVNGFKSIKQLKEMTQDAIDKCVEVYDDLYEGQKKALEKAYSDHQDYLDDIYKATKKSYDKQLNAVKESQDAEVKAFKKATQAKIDLINEEYTESIKLVDEEKYNRIKAIEDEIDALNAETEAENKAQKQRDRDKRIAELKSNIRDADSFEERRAAREAYNDYIQDLEIEETQELREEQIQRLKDEKEAIEDEADQRKEALKKEKDDRITALEDQRETQLELIQKNHQAYREQLSEEYDAELEQLKRHQRDELKEIQDSNTKKLKEYQKYIKAQQKLFEDGGSAKSIDEYVLNAAGYTSMTELDALTSKAAEEGRKYQETRINDASKTAKSTTEQISTYQEAQADELSRVTQISVELSRTYEAKQIKDASKTADNIIKSFNDGINERIESVSDAANAMGSAFMNELDSLFSIHSPSKWAKERGQYIIQGFSEGLADDRNVTRNIKSLASNIESAFDTIASDTYIMPEIRTADTAYANPVVKAMNALQKIVAENTASIGNITVPVYIGRSKVDEIVSNAAKRNNFRSGGW